MFHLAEKFPIWKEVISHFDRRVEDKTRLTGQVTDSYKRIEIFSDTIANANVERGTALKNISELEAKLRAATSLAAN